MHLICVLTGGVPPRPGEISLAHHGVLFLDELVEFNRPALEALREPLETGHITISRAARRAEFPARFQLVAAMNPCPCGHLGSPLRACRCSPDVVSRYQARLSGPLLDRIDLQVEVLAVAPQTLSAAPDGEPTAAIAARVAAAQAVQQARQGVVNAQLAGQSLDEHCGLDAAAAQFLHAAGFHCLSVDIRGHGANAAEALPLSAGEFGLDALAAFHALVARPEVTSGAIVGHSMGAIGAVLAAAADPRVAAVVATSTPADPYRLTRQTFRLARLPIPDPIAYPLAWLTTRVYLRPRAHVVADISASAAIARYAGPILLIHGDADDVVPVAHLSRLAAAARRARAGDPEAAPVETLVIPGGQHSWLYEVAAYRAEVARFLSAAFDGPLTPLHAASLAAATQAERVPAAEERLSAVDTMPGGFRTLVRVALPGATKRVDIEALATADEPGLG